jgi:hypothetical protein
MALITGLAGVLGRFAGRLVNSTLGWATILLFGKVAASRQTLLLLIVLASLGWVAAVVGVIFPDVGTMLIAFVPTPDFIDEGWVRLAMLIAALVLPLVIGVVAIFITQAQHRPRGARILVTILRGYPFTLVLTVTIVILGGVALVRKLRSLAKRWEDAHVPVIVKPGAYEQLLSQLHAVLTGAGLSLAIRPAPRILSAPPRLLDAVAGRALGALVPDKLMLLAAPDLEILVYPSDLAISGSKAAVARSRAAIVSTLTRAPAYLTTSAEAQKVEDEVAANAKRSDQGVEPQEQLRQIEEIDKRLARLTVPFEEWESLYRQRLQVERDVLRQVRETGASAVARRPVSAGTARPLDMAIAVAGLGLIALDLVLLVTQRRRPVT